MKYILLVAMTVITTYAMAWRCDTPISGLNDVSVRSACMNRMLSHWIETLEIDLLNAYKIGLAKGTSQGGYVGDTTNENVVKRQVDRLEQYYRLRDLHTPQVLDMRITNNVAIPMTCSSSSGS